MSWKPGDIANGHILGSDNQWHSLGRKAESGRRPPSPSTAANADSKVNQGLGCGGIAAIVLGLLLLIGIVGSIRDAAKPSTLVLPNFAGQDCKASQAEVDRLFAKTKEGAYQDDTMAEGSPYICTGGVVARTDPPAGTRLNLDTNSSVSVRWWAIEPGAYNWYKDHKTMPDYVGKSYISGSMADFKDGDFVEPGGTYSPGDYFVEDADNSLVAPTSSGYFEDGPHRIVSTTPAAGKSLTIGQKITFHTQVQRGQWVAYDNTDSGSGDGVDVPDFDFPDRLCPTRFC